MDKKFYDELPKKARDYWIKKLGQIETLWNGKKCLGHGAHSLFDLTPLREAGSGLLVKAREQHHYREIPLEHVVFYPKHEDAHHFASTVKQLKNDAPAQSFPGSLGVVIYHSGENHTIITDAQGCYKQNTGTLTNEIERKYLGWLHQAFTEPLEQAIRDGKAFVEFRVKPKNLPKSKAKKMGVEAILPDTIHVFAKAALAQGFKLKSTRIRNSLHDYVICRAINPRLNASALKPHLEEAEREDLKQQNTTYTPHPLLFDNYIPHYDASKPNQKPPITIDGPPRALYRKNKRIRPVTKKR